MSFLENKKPRLNDISLRPSIKHEEALKFLKSAWKLSNLVQNEVEITTEPFPVCLVRNFVQNPKLLTSAVEELSNVTFNEKSNDLYEFKQSNDVKTLTDFSFIPNLYDLVRIDGRKWVSEVIGGCELKEEISATFSSYEYKNRLLCHDDKCEDRHIAFILYLTEDWDTEDGGSLDLFDTDSDGYPNKIVKSISPVFNSFVFFEVSHTSFHQVSEIKSKTKTRLSLNGWFHSREKVMEEPRCVLLKNPQTFANNGDWNLEEYFSGIYLDDMNKYDIKSIFSNKSEIQLNAFILSEFLQNIEEELRSKNMNWIKKGPANMRKYEIALEQGLPSSLQTLKSIFESTTWFTYLKSITGLDLAPAPTSDLAIWDKGQKPSCSFEIQKWTQSCYSLVHDKNPEFHSEALDVIIRFPFESEEKLTSTLETKNKKKKVKKAEESEKKDTIQGGHIVYIDSTSKEEECLLHIGNVNNSLGLIFRDDKTLRFTKYLDSDAKPFYQIFCTYRQWSPPVDEPGLKHCEEDESSDDLENVEDSEESLSGDEEEDGLR